MNLDRIWALVLTVGIAAVVVLGWFLGISPLFSLADQAVAEQQTVVADNAAQQVVLDGLIENNKNLPDLLDRLEEAQGSVPESSGTDDLLEELGTIAGATGSTLSEIVIGEAVPYGTADPNATTAATTTTDGSTGAPGSTLSADLADKVFAMPISIKLVGDPGPALVFIELLQTGNRLVLVTEVNFIGGTTTITGYVFVLRDPIAETIPGLHADEDAEGAPTPTPNPSNTPTPTPTPTPTSTTGP